MAVQVFQTVIESCEIDCMLMANAITKVSACSLRNKRAECACRLGYYSICAEKHKVLRDMIYKGDFA